MASDTPAVDTSSAAPTLERRDSLEKHLQMRPEAEDLKNRHILLDTTAAPALQARQAELERQRITDNLKKGLQKRPEKGELVDRKSLHWNWGSTLSQLVVLPVAFGRRGWMDRRLR